MIKLEITEEEFEMIVEGLDFFAGAVEEFNALIAKLEEQK